MAIALPHGNLNATPRLAMQLLMLCIKSIFILITLLIAEIFFYYFLLNLDSIIEF